MADTEMAKEQVDEFLRQVGALREAIGAVIVGHRPIVDGVLTCMLAGSHALLEGVPGLGKTLLVRTLAQSVGLGFSRIQFTPDLMPADIIGTTVVEDGGGGAQRFEFRKGPVFSNVVLADEVNRATPKTQSALLEAMQEHRVTVGGTTYQLGQPYFVLATQNPLEMEGTYPLPEAQLDRFFFKLHVPFPSREELHTIIDRTTTEHRVTVEPVVSGEDVVRLQRTVRAVPSPRHVQDYAVRLLMATHPELTDAAGAPAGSSALESSKLESSKLESLKLVKRFVATGASPRGGQALLLAAKIRALFAGRFAPSIDDVRQVAAPALRHRVLLNFEGEAESITTDAIIEELLAELPETAD